MPTNSPSALAFPLPLAKDRQHPLIVGWPLRAPLADRSCGFKGSDPLMDESQVMLRIDLPLVRSEDAKMVGDLLLIRVQTHPVAINVRP
jgi:hypothetical protein